MHESTEQLLRFFEYHHLPAPLAEVSSGFHDLAWELSHNAHLSGPELTVCLRKLLEAKDCAVRAALPVRD